MPDEIENRMDKIENNLERLTAITLVLAEHQNEFEEETKARLKALEEDKRLWQEQRQYLDEALGTLIRMMAEWIRHSPHPGSAT